MLALGKAERARRSDNREQNDAMIKIASRELRGGGSPRVRESAVVSRMYARDTAPVRN